jgi:hypothetical protein
MPSPSLNAIAKKLVEKGKGILAADESEGTIAKRFRADWPAGDAGDAARLPRDAVPLDATR